MIISIQVSQEFVNKNVKRVLKLLHPNMGRRRGPEKEDA